MKKNSEFIFLSIISAGVVYVLYMAMMRFGHVWFDAMTAGIVWIAIMAILFVLR